MSVRTYEIYFAVFFYAVFLLNSFATKRIYYISCERPSITYYNKKYVENLNFSAHRYSRRDPMYYINIYVNMLINLDNNIIVNFYAFSFPLNGPVLVERHYKWCDLLQKDEIIGGTLRKFVPALCPTPKGVYEISNLTTSGIPSYFVEHLPLTKGRVYLNSTISNEKLVEGHLDIEVKRMKI